MTLAEFATLVDAPAKWVLNTNALLGLDARYTLEGAERLALIRVLNRVFSIALPRALELATTALHSPAGAREESGVVQLLVDVPRLRAAIATRRSQLATQHAPRRAGRKPGRVAPIAAAKRYGLDVTLLQANLERHPSERLRQLDGMMAFSKAVRLGK
ncbi:MAG TPA: hypothetical protein VFD64_13210 [Gemmatimonadaceae bacterium]|nr:hypothetical protein [Gemmatimonadaceae bacterium]